MRLKLAFSMMFVIGMLFSTQLISSQQVNSASPQQASGASLQQVNSASLQQVNNSSSQQVKGASIQQANSITDTWKTVAPGIDYQEFYLPGPNHAYVARMDRANQSVTLDSSIAQGRLAWGRETVSDMAKRYDESINYWGEQWGNRSHVVIAINGSYYSETTLMPLGGMVNSGWYAKRFDTGNSGFAWTFNRDAFIGRCLLHNPAKQIVVFPDGYKQAINGINVDRTADAPVVLYTPQYNAYTRTDGIGGDILIELSRPAMIISASHPVTGTVIANYNPVTNTYIPFDHVVLSARNPAWDVLQSHAHAGDIVKISQEPTPLDFDCQTPYTTNIKWTETYASIQGNEEFLLDGQIRPFTNPGSLNRNPRTAIAFNDQYIYFIVVDGRNSLSAGMTIEELAHFTKDVLGATNGINQDGGGSSTMWVNGQVMNKPSDCKFKFSFVPSVNAAPSLGNVSAGSVQPTPTPQVIEYPCERPVLNGMMMVMVEPRESSSYLGAGNSVLTVSAANVRLGPGTNYPAFTSVKGGVAGTIVDHPLNGVLAKGENWWKVDFGNGITGWVAESLLASQLTNASYHPFEFGVH
ncbi:MAG: phosphodiester glycosidase family protein [Omnitrophica WOR_2 bacterium]